MKEPIRFGTTLSLPLLVMIVILSKTPSCDAQGRSSSFALYSQLPVSSRPIGLLLADVNADSANELAVLSRNPSSLSLYRVADTGAIVREQEIVFADSCDICAAGQLNGDRMEDVAVLFKQAHVIRFYFGQSNGRLREGGQFYLDGNYDAVTIADVTQDGRPDIILYGKKNLGITVLAGNGDGTFRLPLTIFPDMPAGKVLVQSLNGDGIPDLVVLDWVTNTISFYYGNGIGGFSEQTTFHLSDDIDDLEVADLDGNTTPDLAVISSKSNSLYTFFGTGSGEFFKAQIIHLSFSPASVTACDINGDGRVDLCILDRQNPTAAVYLNTRRGFFGEGTFFAAGSALTASILGPLGRDRYPDLITADRHAERLNIYWNERKKDVRSNEFALGHSPSGLAIGDFNQDGSMDIAVADRESPTLSLLFGREKHGLRGQVGVDVDSPIEAVSYIGTQYGKATIIGTDDRREQLSVFSIDLHSITANVSQIATGGIPSFAHGWLSHTGLVNFLTLNLSQTVPLSVSHYEQIAGMRFIEKNYTPAAPSTMLGVAVSDINNDNHFDLAYVAKDRQFSRPYLAVSFSDSLTEFHGRRLSFFFPDTALTTVIMAAGDCNNDGRKDLVIATSGPGVTPKLFVAINRGDSTFALTRQSFMRVEVTNSRHLKLRDAGGDGIIDLLLVNDLTKTLLLYKGRGDGTFAPPRTIVDADDVSDFDCADIFSDGTPRILITNPHRNTLQVLTIK